MSQLKAARRRRPDIGDAARFALRSIKVSDPGTVGAEFQEKAPSFMDQATGLGLGVFDYRPVGSVRKQSTMLLTKGLFGSW